MSSFQESVIELIPQSDTENQEVVKLSKEFNISPIICKILNNRGFKTAKDFKDFLKPTLRESLPDPKNIKNMPELADILVKAIEGKKVITLYTDFDVDGLTSGSQLYTFLSKHGALVNRYTPNRFNEGYGLNTGAIEKLIKSKTEVLVCLDCGTSSVKEITKAKNAGMEVLVIDHHKLPDDLPPADALVNPANPDCPFNQYQMCTAGLVWMLIVVLAGKLKNELNIEVQSPKDYLDLAAIGTICDMVPLVSVNRLITIRGLELLEKTKNIGLLELMKVSKVKSKVKASCVSFGIGPRINAAGRMEEGKQVIDLLTTKSKNEAEKICKKIETLNNRRKNLESKIRNKSIRVVENSDKSDYNSIVYYDKDNHLGVVGIVAQRLVEVYNKPSAVMGDSPTDDSIVKGSIRGIEGVNIAEFLHGCSDILISGGGHKKAGGFSFKKEFLDDFTNRFHDYVSQNLKKDDFRPRVNADYEIDFSHLSLELAKEVTALSPFGIGNPNPVFYTKGVNIKSVSTIGETHLKLILSKDNQNLTAVAWGQKGNKLLKSENQVNLAYNLDINNYRGVSSVQLNIKGVQDFNI